MTGETLIKTGQRDELGQLFDKVARLTKIDLSQFEYEDVTYDIEHGRGKPIEMMGLLFC